MTDEKLASLKETVSKVESLKWRIARLKMDIECTEKSTALLVNLHDSSICVSKDGYVDPASGRCGSKLFDFLYGTESVKKFVAGLRERLVADMKAELESAEQELAAL